MGESPQTEVIWLIDVTYEDVHVRVEIPDAELRRNLPAPLALTYFRKAMAEIQAAIIAKNP